jgi:signal transduction histidine kinase
MEKMPKRRLPVIITGIGVILSVGVFFLLDYHIKAYNEYVDTLQPYLPWVALIVGISISILVALVARMTQMAHFRTQSLNEMNENLKREINERVSAEETKQKLEIALLQGQKLQAMGNLAGGIAHDFNNLLYAIIGYVEMAREDVAKDTPVYANLGKVLEASHRGQELVSRILSFSRRQHHKFSPLNLKTTIEGVLSLLRPTIPTSVMINFDSQAAPEILGNQTQLHQVLVNLINNAVDAMDGEGHIDIRLSELAANDPYLKQFPETKKQVYSKIEVQDSGHGMDQSTMERIFDPFFTTKEVGKGTGLGLSIVHGIVKEHAGEITVTSQLGHGTSFIILLPEHTAAS